MPKKRIAASIIAVLLINGIPTYAMAGFTAKKFLGWEKSAQDSFLQISISMAGVITTQTHTKMADCIDNWYFKDDETRFRRNKTILETMAKYLDHHPAGIVAASIERACGKFSDRD
ncbi:MAG: hypothetical protein JKY55_06535 [Aliivibrio sp.]|uniref:hypothetical protein n=1 Tax=Aliivibrio sp. TaxID=1872443 RepID=UPI001A47C2B4|nr:hypothetical protein [Aliivibrio sp.]